MLEAAVVGIPDPEWGEAVVGVVALKDGRVGRTGLTARGAREQGLPSDQGPRSGSRCSTTLPKNAVGKIAKRDLRDSLWQGERKA